MSYIKVAEYLYDAETGNVDGPSNDNVSETDEFSDDNIGEEINYNNDNYNNDNYNNDNNASDYASDYASVYASSNGSAYVSAHVNDHASVYVNDHASAYASSNGNFVFKKNTDEFHDIKSIIMNDAQFTVISILILLGVYVILGISNPKLI